MKQPRRVIYWVVIAAAAFLVTPVARAVTPHHDLTVDVFESDGVTPIGGAQVKYTWSGSGGIYTLGTTNAFGRLLGLGMTPGTYQIWVEHAWSRSASQTVVVTGSNWTHLTFNTVETIIRVEDSDHNPIVGAQVKYGPSYIGTFGTTGADGKARKELFAGESNLKFLVDYNWTTSPEQWAVVSAADPLLTFTTTTVFLRFSGTTLLNRSGLHSFTSPIELFEGTWNFRFEIGPWDDKKVAYLDIPVSGPAVNKTIGMLRLLDHSGSPLSGGTARGGTTTPTQWHVTGSTNAAGLLLDCRDGLLGSLAYEMKYNNTVAVQGPQDPAVNSYFEFQTALVTLKLKTCDGTLLDGGRARYGLGSTHTTWWFPGGVTGSAGPGLTEAEFFPGRYSFEMMYRATAQVMPNEVIGPSGATILWKTTKVTLHHSHTIAYGGPTGDSQYFTSPMELLPGTVWFNFRDPAGHVRRQLTFSGCSYEKTVAIVRVKTSGGDGRPGYSGQWYVADPCAASAWGPTDADGVDVILIDGLPTQDTTVCLHYGSKTDCLTQPADTQSTYCFVPQNTLQVASTGGGSVTTPGEGSFVYDHNTLVNLETTLDPHYHFEGYSGSAVDANRVADPCSLTTTVWVDDDYDVLANIAIDQHNVRLSSSAGGDITELGEGDFLVDWGTQFLLTAEPAGPLFHFAYYTGTFSTWGNPYLLTVEHDHDIRAVFESVLDVIYVDDDAPNDLGPFDLWVSDPCEDGTRQHPFDSIQEAVEVAAAGATVVVLPGTYPESLQLTRKAITVTSVDPAADAPAPQWPVIEAPGDQPVVTLTRCEDANCVLEGLVLTGANGNHAAGIVCDRSLVRVQNCLIVGNRRLGGAMPGGAALWARNSQATLLRCTLADNYGGTHGAGVFVSEASDVVILDSILWGNSPQETRVEAGSTLAIESSDVAGGFAGSGNLDVDPLFVGPGHWENALTPGQVVAPNHALAVWVAGDYHLGGGSPCIDAGDPLADFSLEPEPNGARLNQGAYGNTPEAATTP